MHRLQAGSVYRGGPWKGSAGIWFSADSEFAGSRIPTVPAYMQDNLTVRTVWLLLQIAIVTVRFQEVLADYFKTLRRFVFSGIFPEPFRTCIAQGIEAGFTFLFQGIAAPVQVGHESTYRLMPGLQKADCVQGTPENGLTMRTTARANYPSRPPSPAKLKRALVLRYNVDSFLAEKRSGHGGVCGESLEIHFLKMQ